MQSVKNCRYLIDNIDELARSILLTAWKEFSTNGFRGVNVDLILSGQSFENEEDERQEKIFLWILSEEIFVRGV